MFKYSKYTLKKIEEIFNDLEYKVRFEKGSFQSGYCIVENKNIIVINRFYDTEARINCMLDILQHIDFDQRKLRDSSAQFYKKIEKMLQQNKEQEEGIIEEETDSSTN